MQDQPNPLGGSHEGNPGGLGVTRCDRCGAPDRSLDAEGYCPMCQKIEAHTLYAMGEASLEIFRAALRTTLEGNAHPDDVRRVVAEELPDPSREGYPRRLADLHQKIDELYLAGVR